jgi:hypothetical protein
MPKFRALHTKIIDSFDFNEMPDDFHRVTWILLPLILDCEGRGIDNPAWIKSKMYPLRLDVTAGQISSVFDWLADHQMIVRYTVKGRRYFYVPTFKAYQKGTEKEAASVLPTPDLLQTNSGVTTEQVRPAEYAYAYEYESVNESDSLNKTQNSNSRFPCAESIFLSVTGWNAIPSTKRNDIEEMITAMQTRYKTSDDLVHYLKPFWLAYKSRYPSSTTVGWLEWAAAGQIPDARVKSNGGHQTDEERRRIIEEALKDVE